jgi:hypothetical protein
LSVEREVFVPDPSSASEDFLLEEGRDDTSTEGSPIADTEALVSEEGIFETTVEDEEIILNE